MLFIYIEINIIYIFYKKLLSGVTIIEVIPV